MFILYLRLPVASGPRECFVMNLREHNKAQLYETIADGGIRLNALPCGRTAGVERVPPGKRRSGAMNVANSSN